MAIDVRLSLQDHLEAIGKIFMLKALERVQPVLRVRLEPLAQVLLEHSEE